jgi:2-dehydro-3-deoxyglucarate aldolase/4-hydroxy-2-oxoheptanedioate aldolase
VTNYFRDRLATRELKLGHYIGEFCTPGIGHILKGAGCEWVWLDMEHSGFGFETVKMGLRFFEAAGLPALVRLPSGSYENVARVCDVGAEAVTVPNVRTAEEAARIVAHMKYPPVGHRGVAVGIAHDNYRAGPVPETLQQANERTVFFALIESEEGLRNVDAIAAVDGVDALFLGHYDLTVSMGIPGDFANARFTDAVRTLLETAKRHGKAVGRSLASVKDAADAYASGFTFLTYSGDVWLYRQALAQAMQEVKAAVGKG